MKSLKQSATASTQYALKKKYRSGTFFNYFSSFHRSCLSEHIKSMLSLCYSSKRTRTCNYLSVLQKLSYTWLFVFMLQKLFGPAVCQNGALYSRLQVLYIFQHCNLYIFWIKETFQSGGANENLNLAIYLKFKSKVKKSFPLVKIMKECLVCPFLVHFQTFKIKMIQLLLFISYSLLFF